MMGNMLTEGADEFVGDVKNLTEELQPIVWRSYILGMVDGLEAAWDCASPEALDILHANYLGAEKLIADHAIAHGFKMAGDMSNVVIFKPK